MYPSDKECARAVRHSLPFKTLPKKLLKHMIFYVVKLINTASQQREECLTTTAQKPSWPVTLFNKNYYSSMTFGTYCQVHENDGPQTYSRCHISLKVVMSWEATTFYKLSTGRIVVLAMPPVVIERVNTFLNKEEPMHLTFEDRHGHQIGDWR